MTVYKLEITANTLEELLDELGKQHGWYKAKATTAAPVVVTAQAVASAPSAPDVKAKKPEAKKPEVDEAPKDEVKKYDFNRDIASATLAAVEAHGRTSVTAILAGYGVTRASQVDEKHYPDFLKKLAALGGGA